jgi:3-oxoacyl-[acyl-carrier protein] reductase
MARLDGKVAVVTGAARGIGLEYAMRLGSLGASVAVCDRDLRSAQAYASEAARLTAGGVVETLESLGTRAMASEVDVTSVEDVIGFVDEIRRAWNRVDVVVCNAGGGAGDTVTALPSTMGSVQAHDLLERNFFGTVNTVQAVVPVMKEQGSGKIITVSSVAGVRSERSANGADYAVAKAAIVSYTRNLAQELGPFGITANAIAPGFIASGQWRVRFAGDDVARLEEKARTVPLRRLGTPEDCARVIEFLATDLSDYVTGQVIVVDGGRVTGAA